jgi:hypothetical protein
MSDPADTWVKSSYCSDTTCVEVKLSAGDVLVRDGKRRDQQVLRFSRTEWDNFLNGVAAGDFRFQ